MRSLLVELVGVALIAAGTYFVVGIAVAFIVTGILVLIGAQLYCVEERPAGLVTTEPANEETF